MKEKAALTKIDYLWRCWMSILVLDSIFMGWAHFVGFDRYLIFGSLDFSDFLIAYWWLIGAGVLMLLILASYPLIFLDSRQPLTLRFVWSVANFFFSIPATILYWLAMIEVPRYYSARDSGANL